MKLMKFMFYLTIGLFAGSILAFLIWFIPIKVRAIANQVCICHNVEHNPVTVCSDYESILQGHGNHLESGFDERGSCATVTPTPIPSTPTPTPGCFENCIPTPTPIDSKCDFGFHFDEELDGCVEDGQPTPTVTPTPAAPAPQPCNGCGQTMAIPVCTNQQAFIPPKNFNVERAGDSATLRWIPTQGDQVNIYYKNPKAINWEHSVRDVPNDGVEVINGLGSNDWSFGLQQKFGCGGGDIISVVVDSALPRLFTFSYYTR